MAGEAALGHAWDWFALHAKQRMQCVNFFFVAAAFLAAGYVTALTQSRPGLALGIGGLGAWLSIWFNLLDRRTRQLVDAGQDAMEPLQLQLAQETQNTRLGLVARVNGQEKKRPTYSTVIRVLHWTAVLAFLIGAGYAATLRAGVYVEVGPFRAATADPWQLQGIGLILGALAAVMLAFLPPPHWSHYTREGAGQITFTGRQTRWGTWLWWLSYSGPVLLAASFAVQYLAWRAGGE